MVQTSGEASHGVFAQSVGGGGGQGGMVGVDEDTFGAFLTGSTSGSVGTNSNSINVSVGGAGGAGNSGGSVTVNSAATILTMGDQAVGVYAQSIGGGGGDGGVGFATSGSFGKGNNGDYAIGIGGSGGTGSVGGSVDVTNTGTIVTLGGAAHGVFAQSVGGGGGRGGDAGGFVTSYNSTDGAGTRDTQVSVSMGGSGGTGGDGGSVTVDNQGAIGVSGEMSNGIFAQSVGGGGGEGGLVSQSGELVKTWLGFISNDENRAASINIGGSGGAAGDGGDVVVTNSGVILADNARSGYGIFAQSVGGGGGVGGSGLAGNVAVGGAGGAAGDGGNVTIDNSGMVTTTGSNAHGIFAQSIGGGGGVGGATDYDDSNDSRTALGAAIQSAADLTEFYQLLDSFNNPSLTLNIGGRGGAAGDGGDINITNSGSIRTTGDGAHGIMAQSIGGGGGVGGAGSVGAWGDVTISGIGGSAGDGGDINITHVGDITTEGFGAYGIFAQSIGGGGGAAGDYSFGFGTYTTNVGLNPFSGGDGDGGDITIRTNGNINIRGFGATGIFAQSVGGGGGLLGNFGSQLGSLGSFLGAGTAGEVNIIHTGDVIVPDVNGVAVLLQSDARDGTDDLSITLDSDIRGGSLFGLGVFFDGGANNVLNTGGTLSAVSGQAITMTTGNDTVNNTGWVVGNIDLGSGLNAFNNELGSTFMAFTTIDLGGPQPSSPQEPLTVVAGDKGLVQVQDTVSTVSSDKPLVMVQDSALPAVPVSGMLNADSKGTAQVQDDSVPVNTNGKGFAPVQDGLTSASANAITLPDTVQVQRELTASAPAVSGGTFTNDGTFLMGLSATTRPIDLRAGETFYNLDADGDPLYNIFYGARVVNQVALNGDYVQTANGHLVFDVAYGPYDYDHVTLTGDVTVAGTGDVTFIWLSDNDPIPLFTSTGGTATNNGLEITDTLAVDFSVRAEANRIMLDIETDFGGVDGLNRNERSLGAHMDSNLDVGGAEGTGRLLAWLGNLQDPDLYKYIMTELNPEPHIAVLQGLTNTSLSFSDDLINCGTPSSMRSEEECNWSRMDVGTADRDRSFERFSTQADTFSVRAGFQRPINDTWNAGAAIGYESVNYHDIDGTRAGTNGEGVTLGATVNRDFHGGGIFAATLSGGWMKYDMVRLINVFEPQIAQSNPEAGYVDLRVRSGLMTEFDNGFYILPRADLSFTNLIHNGFHETGADGIGMRSDGDSDWMITGSPAVEFGWTREYEDGREFRASATFGGRLHSDDYLGLPMSFAEAPAGVIPAMIETQIDQEMYTFDAGFEFIQGDRVNLSFSYRGEYGETSDNHQAGFQLGVRF